MNPHKKTIFIMFPLVLVLAITALFLENPSKFNRLKDQNPMQIGDVETVKVLSKDVVVSVVNLIKDKDFKELTKYVDEEEGVFIKPYYTPSEDRGLVLKASELPDFFKETENRNWGFEDGSGLPMRMTSEEYYEKYIYSQDFVTLGSLTINETQAEGNTLSLDQVLSEVYGEETVQFGEYYIPGTDERYGGMDWESLALVFKVVAGEWKLVGIFHNEWTI